MQSEIAKQHITSAGTVERENTFPRSTITYDVYECDHCDEEFKVRSNHDKYVLYRRVMDHLEDEHPEALERDEYRNEAAFHEWADRIDRNVEEPRVPGDPLVVRWSEMKLVQLHPDGTVTLEAYKTLGDEDARVEGNRLVVASSWGRESYVSDRAFPIR